MLQEHHVTTKKPTQLRSLCRGDIERVAIPVREHGDDATELQRRAHAAAIATRRRLSHATARTAHGVSDSTHTRTRAHASPHLKGDTTSAVFAATIDVTESLGARARRSVVRAIAACVNRNALLLRDDVADDDDDDCAPSTMSCSCRTSRLARARSAAHRDPSSLVVAMPDIVIKSNMRLRTVYCHVPPPSYAR
jgi:hypothetical protein